MKAIIATVLMTGLATSPYALAVGSFDDADRAIQAGLDYGITQFRSIELDDDKDMEVEGWLDDGWYVEIDLDRNASLEKEKRQKRGGEPWGISAEDLRAYLDVARQNGMTMLEEIEVKSDGYVEVEGDDERGRELEIKFRLGEMNPIDIDRDN
ncbi:MULTISPECIES: hypothetical protein [Marinobacter]|uniref:PepSY domain-containing protein n=2 Tax=Marinobacter TaxID=2742 RepID=A0A1M2V1E9_MARNT|nr:hypothetical protein [Marinobacter nauticus]OJT01410.1 hypothetical protein BEE62_04690 [Marinobacter nauticus]